MSFFFFGLNPSGMPNIDVIRARCYVARETLREVAELGYERVHSDPLKRRRLNYGIGAGQFSRTDIEQADQHYRNLQNV